MFFTRSLTLLAVGDATSTECPTPEVDEPEPEPDELPPTDRLHLEPLASPYTPDLLPS